MIKFDVLNRFSGEVQFTAEIDANESDSDSVKLGLAVKWAIENKADLRFTDLSYADLRSASLRSADMSSSNLSGADLRFADLSYSNLRSANMSSANLRSSNISFSDLCSANFRYADLSYSDLSSANIHFADLSSCKLQGANLYVLITDFWVVYIQPEHIRISCKYHKADEWFRFSDEEIRDMECGALDWWHKWKPVIQAAHKVIISEKKYVIEGR